MQIKIVFQFSKYNIPSNACKFTAGVFQNSWSLTCIEQYFERLHTRVQLEQRYEIEGGSAADFENAISWFLRMLFLDFLTQKVAFHNITASRSPARARDARDKKYMGYEWDNFCLKDGQFCNENHFQFYSEVGLVATLFPGFMSAYGLVYLPYAALRTFARSVSSLSLFRGLPHESTEYLHYTT